MIRATVDVERGFVQCGRASCLAPIGYCDQWQDVGYRLSLSRKWHLDAAAKPPRWRMGQRKRTGHATGQARGARARGRDPIAHADTVLVKGGAEWRAVLPLVIECPRCHAVQEVPEPPRA